MAIRVALGARRTELLRMLAAEVAVITAAGAVLGVLLSRWFALVLMRWVPAVGFPVQLELSVDWRVFAFAILCAGLSAVLFGLLPALRMSNVDVTPALKNELALSLFRRFQLRDAYVAVQISIAVVLLSSAVIMARAIQSTLSMDIGMRPENAVMVRFSQYLQGYTPEQGRDLQRRVLERVRNLPGIQVASMASSVPLSIDQSTTSIFIDGAPEPKASDVPSAAIYGADPDFFRAFGTDMLSGRDFNERDQANSPAVVIVNKAFVDKLFSGQDALGRRVRSGRSGNPLEIVGVVETGKYQHLFERPIPAIWIPLEQRYYGTSGVVARTTLDESAAIAAIKNAIAEADPSMSTYDEHSLRTFLDFPMSPLTFAGASLNMMSGLAIFLSGLGIYGLLSYSMARRRREIGIRVALGATRWDVMRSLTSKTAILIGLSAGIGLLLSFLVSRLLSPLLLTEPAFSSYGIAVVIVVAIAAGACILPTEAALRIEPSSALRYD